MVRDAAIVVCAVWLVACNDDAASGTPPPATPPPDAGPAGCVPGERPLDDGTCLPAGVRPESCAEGFTPDDDRGCTPILPAEACGDGLMAIPGDTECREVAPCGVAPWGDIPVDASTQYVDASYAGMDSDGSELKPWTTIGAAVQAADDGAIVAIAEGSYPEDVLVFTKPVRLWGRCPALVEIAGTPDGLAAIDIRAGADGAEVHTLAVTGPRGCVGASGAEGVLIDRIWAHHCDHAAIATEATLGAGSLTIEGCLLEDSLEYGIFDDSVDITLSRSVIRDIQAGPVAPGRGINLQTHLNKHVATANITSCVLERTTELAIFVFASKITVDATVIQDTVPNDRSFGGRALNIEDDPDTGARSDVTVRSSVFQHNQDIEVTCTGCDLTMESTTMRDTLPLAADMTFGRGFSTQDRFGRANVTIRESVVTRTRSAGMLVDGSDVTLESVLIRDIGSDASDLGGGRGLGVQYGLATPQRANVVVRWSVIEGVRETGITSVGSDLTLEGTLVRDARGTEAAGTFGDGVSIVVTNQGSNAWITGSRIDGAVRAGISNFGGHVEISNTTLDCNPIQLNGELLEGTQSTFADLGGVVCGCGETPETCAISSTVLEPPEPLVGQ